MDKLFWNLQWTIKLIIIQGFRFHEKVLRYFFYKNIFSVVHVFLYFVRLFLNEFPFGIKIMMACFNSMEFEDRIFPFVCIRICLEELKKKINAFTLRFDDKNADKIQILHTQLTTSTIAHSLNDLSFCFCFLFFFSFFLVKSNILWWSPFEKRKLYL